MGINTGIINSIARESFLTKEPKLLKEAFTTTISHSNGFVDLIGFTGLIGAVSITGTTGNMPFVDNHSSSGFLNNIMSIFHKKEENESAHKQPLNLLA